MTGFHVEVSEVSEGIAVVTIDRPKANAIDAATSRAMGEAFVGFEHDPTVRVVIVTGAGERFFSAGWDLGAAAEGEAFDADYGAGGFGGFPDLPDRCTPVIAAVNGMAVGGGFEIALAADMIVAAEHATFFLPEAGIGVLPDAGSVRLPRLLPPHIAREVLVAGRRLTATEAAHFGLVNRVVAGVGLLAAAREMAAAVIASAPLSVAAILDIGRRTAQMDPIDAMAAIKSLESYRRAVDSEDAHEGNLSFTEKRPPVWKGR
jgi:crotonobetainyl-CoA hydratase